MFWASVALFIPLITSAPAALINLQAYVMYALMNSDGTMPLADGSIVQIIGSYDDIANPMEHFGGGIIAEPRGDDTLIATITIQSSILASNGTFYTGDFYFESDEVRYMYIRFFDTTGALAGDIAWGESPVLNAEHDQFGGIFMDFVGGYSADTHDNFVVIPEPGTLNLLLVWVSMVAAMRNHLRRERDKKKPARKQTRRRAPPREFIIYDHF